MLTHKVPTIADLYAEDESRKDLDDLLIILNQPVHRPWVKINKYVKPKEGMGPHEYLPIEKVKWLLVRIFGRYTWKITHCYQIFNSIVVVGTLTVPLPGGGIWQMDGIGAMVAQSDAGATIADISKIKADAMQKGAPSASSYALKNAAEQLGRVFGSELNQSDFTEFAPVFAPSPVESSAPPIIGINLPPQIKL